MAFYSKDEIARAKQIDIYSYLKNKNPDELVYFSRGTYTTREHDSLKISNGMWYWFSKGIGGKSALDHLIQVKEYSFTDAMAEVLEYSNEHVKYQYTEKKKDNIELQLPEKNESNDKVISYLKSRGIDEDIIKELVYESKENHNVVFVGYDMNFNPKFGCVRGTKNTFTTIAKIAKVLDSNLNYLADGINNYEEKDNNNYVITIKRIDENCIQLESKNRELLLKLLKEISYEIDSIDLNIGEEIKLKIKSIL